MMKILLKILSVLVCVAFAGICFHSAYLNITIAHYTAHVIIGIIQLCGGLCWIKILNDCFNWINKKF